MEVGAARAETVPGEQLEAGPAGEAVRHGGADLAPLGAGQALSALRIVRLRADSEALLMEEEEGARAGQAVLGAQLAGHAGESAGATGSRRVRVPPGRTGLPTDSVVEHECRV